MSFAEVLKTADSSLGEVVDRQSIRELPLNGRMLLDLALTVRGSCSGPLGRFVQRGKDLFFSCSLRLLLSENVSVTTVPCAQSQHVPAAQAADQSFHYCRTPRWPTDLFRQLRGQSRIDRPAHQVSTHS